MGSHSEARRSPRKLVLMRGVITDRDGSAIPCVIRDVSWTGCRVICAAAHELPDRIKLKLERISQPIDGRIMWRRGKMAGIELCFSGFERPSAFRSSGTAFDNADKPVAATAS